MAFEGYLEFGGVEVVNNERLRGYSRTSACASFVPKDSPCETLEDALGALAAVDGGTVEPYTYDNITGAPWYDWTNPDVSSRFFGVFATSIRGDLSSTRSASVTEGIADGGVIGSTRHTSREMRVRVMLLARGEDALEYGVRWLDAMLDADACGRHGDQCGTTDLMMLTACPPARLVDPTPPVDPEEPAEDESDADYAARINEYQRWLHSVAAVSGPFEVEGSKVDVADSWKIEMEFVLVAGRPWVYSRTRPVDLPTTPSTIVDDIPKNLIPYPSAEIQDATPVVVARNYSTNPSVEVNATGWTAAVSAISGTAPAAYFTSGRVSEIAANRAWSFKGQIVQSGAAAGRSVITLSQTVTPDLSVPNTRISVNIWGAALSILGGANTVIHGLDSYAQWLDAANAAVGPLIKIGGAEPDQFGGHPFRMTGMLPPAGATKIRVWVWADVSWGAGSDVRVYADALAVSVP